MEAINNIDLRDKNKYPDDMLLKSILNDSYQAYKELLELYAKNEMNFEWRYYNDGEAWLCKVQKKKITIVWMSVWKNFLQATIYFPEKYIDKLCELDIGETIKENIQTTKNVGKSKPCTFKIKDTGIINDFEKVMIYKIDTTRKKT